MEIPGGLVAFVVVMGIAYWINSSRDEKERVSANEKEAKAVKVKSDDMERSKSEIRKTIHSRALEFGVDYTDAELDWICDSAESRSGEKGLADIGRAFATAPKGTVEKIMMKIEKDHLMHLVDQQAEQRSVGSEYKWQIVLDDFKRLNPAQQKAHLVYIKKHTNELTEEQLHILELVSLGERAHSSNRDVTVGDVKLPTLKEK